MWSSIGRNGQLTLDDRQPCLLFEVECRLWYILAARPLHHPLSSLILYAAALKVSL